MTAAPTPIDEARRLAVLRANRILDTEPEREFDQLVALAAHVTGAPIALVSLVDESRQWFKARIGLDVAETPRAHAFCAYAILNSAPLIVEDAAVDVRFTDNPLVTGAPGIRFYAGFPLDAGDGLRLGSLCVIDTQPRSLRSDQLAAMQALAHQASCQLQLRHALLELQILRERELGAADRSLEARAREAFRAGQELQSGLATELLDIVAALRAHRSAAGAVPVQACDALDIASQRIAAAALDCRALADRFRDFRLLSLGWIDAVRTDINRLQAEYGVQISLEPGVDPDQILEYAAAQRLAEYVHAALHTAVEQLGATQLRVAVVRRGTVVLLTITCLGGHDGATLATQSPNARLRVLAAELGSVVHESRTAQGTELALTVELSPAVALRGGG